MSARPSPTVARLAVALGVNASRLTGTGAGGRVTVADVRASAQGRVDIAAAPSVKRDPAVDRQWARNPLIDAVREESPTIYKAAAAIEAPPTMFTVGDLPLFTASGIEPATLLELPWMARHAAAAASERARVARIFEQCRPRTEEALAVADSYADAEGAREYRVRVDNWISGNTAAQRAAASPFPEPMTEAELSDIWSDMGISSA